MRRHSRGIYEFATRPAEIRLMPARFRSLMEQGRAAEAMQPVNDALWLAGYGCYQPDFRILCEDLSPAASRTETVYEGWLQETVEVFNHRTLRLGERVAAHYGYDYVRRHFCPVCWGRPQGVSEKELAEKIGAVAACAAIGREPGILLDNYAVTDESKRLYGVSMPVVWMRYSYLRRFKSGQDIINVYRMMKNSERVYDIPPFPYEGMPDCMI